MALEMLSFDCYGTLIDWERGILQSLRPVLDRHELSATDAELLERYAGFEAEIEQGPYRPYREVLRQVAERFSEAYDFPLDLQQHNCLVDGLGSWPPFPDTAGALGRLATRYRLAVLSNVDRELFAYSQRLLGVDFDLVVTAEEVVAYKPDPRMFEALLARSGCAPAQLLHVAQSLYHDVAPAKALGWQVAWINRRGDQPGSGATPPAEAVPDQQYPDLASLADALLAPAE